MKPAYLSDDNPIPLASDDQLANGARLATQLVKLEESISSTEEMLKTLKSQHQELAHKIIPDFFTETLHTDHIGVPDQQADVTIVPYYKANIPASWPEPQREAAFSHLTELGHGDAITNTITLTFPRSHEQEALDFLQKLQSSSISNIATITHNKSIPWATLTALVKDEILSGNGENLDLPTLGATVGRVAKVKKRKI